MNIFKSVLIFMILGAVMSFSSCGSDQKQEVTVKIDGTTIEYVYKIGEVPDKITAEITVPANKEFEYWYCLENGKEVKLTDSDGNFLKEWNYSVDTTIYAKFKNADIKINIDGEEKQYIITYNEFPEIILPIKEKAGHKFLYYFYDNNGEEVQITDEKGVFIKKWNFTSKDSIVYPKYQALKIRISFDTNGTDEVIESKEATFGELIEDKFVLPKKLGYSFLGWFVGEEKVTDEFCTLQRDYLRMNALYGSEADILRGEVTVMAMWQINTYKILLALDGGTFDGGDHVDVVYGEQINRIGAATKTGYTFNGWYSKDNIEYEFGNNMPAQNIELFAKWIVNKYTITFEYNGGNAPSQNMEIEFGSKIANLPITAKDRQKFVSWSYSNSSAVADYLKDGDVYVKPENVTVYAIWSDIEIEVTFDSKTTEKFPKKTIINGRNYTDFPIPSRKGWTFLGWFTVVKADDGTTSLGVHVAQADGNSDGVINLVENAMLEAGWRQNEYALMLDPNIDNLPTYELKKYHYNDPFGVLPTLENLYKKFKCWSYSKTDAINTVKAEGLFDKTETITIYAHWDDISVTIEFNTDCELSTPTNRECKAGEFITNLPILSGDDREFLGWTYINKNGQKVDLTDKNDLNKSVQIPAPDDSGIILATAKWKWEGNKVLFDSDGGSLVGEIVVTAQNLYRVIHKPTNPTKNGYTFIGWFLNDNIIDFKTQQFKADTTTLKAKWSLVKYKIIYNLDGGENNALNKQEYTIEEKITLSEPTKTGYTFVSWNDNGVIEKGSFGDKTFTATWKIVIYSITYDFTNVVINTPVNNKNPATYTITDTIIELVAPTREGYTFKSWIGGGIINKGETGNKAFSVEWTVNKYKFTYDYNDATSGATELGGEFEFGSLVKNEFVKPDKTNYTFGGWFDNENNEYKKGSQYTRAGDIVLKAKWLRNIYLHENGLEGNIFKTVLEAHKQPFKNLTAPTLNGYTFDGWYDDIGGNGALYSDISVFDNAQDLHLYAKFVANVTFDFKNAENTIRVIPKIYNAKVGALPNDLVKEGNELIGWTYKKDGIFAQVTENTILTFVGDITISAVWQTSITFDYQGATGDNNLIVAKIIYEKTLESGLPLPTKNNNKFAGWYTSVAGGGNEFTANMPYSYHTPIKLYAKWLVTLTFDYADADGGAKPDSIDAVYNAPLDLGLVSPLKTGCSFVKWTVENGNSIVAGDIVNFDENIKITAQWSINRYKLVIEYMDTQGIVLSRKTEAIIEYGSLLELDSKWEIGKGYLYSNHSFWVMDGDEKIDVGVVGGRMPAFELHTTCFLKFAPYNYYGEGVKESPYLLYAWGQLFDLERKVNDSKDPNSMLGEYFRVENDISLLGKIFIPIGNNLNEQYFVITRAQFRGHFDGGGHTISDIVIDDNFSNQNCYVGFFGYLGFGSSVKNLKLANIKYSSALGGSLGSNNKGGAHVGGIAGINNGIISDCQVLRGSIYSEAKEDTHVGGIAGYMYFAGGKVPNEETNFLGAGIYSCTNSANVYGISGRWTSIGGICGSSNNSEIFDCINNGKVDGALWEGSTSSSALFHGGISGVNAGYIANCVNNGAVSGHIDNAGKEYVSVWEDGKMTSEKFAGAAYLGEVVGYMHDGSYSAADRPNEGAYGSDYDKNYKAAYLKISRQFNVLGVTSVSVLSNCSSTAQAKLEIKNGKTYAWRIADSSKEGKGVYLANGTRGEVVKNNLVAFSEGNNGGVLYVNYSSPVHLYEWGKKLNVTGIPDQVHKPGGGGSGGNPGGGGGSVS